jgi:hypothetical protein
MKTILSVLTSLPLRSFHLSGAIAEVRQALLEPEQFASDWHERRTAYLWYVWLALAATAIAGTLCYGMTMGILGGPFRVLTAGLTCTLAAGLAWGIPLPALYILNSLTGSRLPLGSTVLAALVTTSWGGLAMMASIPINWFFTVAVPHPQVVLVVNLVVFTGVGFAMIDTFGRVMARLEPERGWWPVIWLLLVAILGTELFYHFGLFQFDYHGSIAG